MKAILCLPLFLALGLCADEARDRAAIDKAIAALNDPAQRAGLFTKDTDSGVNFERLIDLHKKACSPLRGVIGTNETWTQLTAPRIVTGSIRFLTPKVAMVEGASVIEGAVTLARSVPLLFVMKKEGTKWRISTVRILASGGTMRVGGVVP